MRRVSRQTSLLPALYVAVLAALVYGFSITAQAGIRGPGKYCGVVVFDRWDTCFLLSGPYITYISDSVKDELRPYRGTEVQVDASNVYQPRNPGDALIRKYRIVGPAPVLDNPPKVDGLELIAQSDFGSGGAQTFLVEVRNSGNKPVQVLSAELGPALLGKNQRTPFSPSDGSSVALITRTDLALLMSGGTENRLNHLKYSVAYTKDSPDRLPERFNLDPGQTRKARVTFNVPSGQYQFIIGYGGGVHEQKSLASKAISFDVNDSGVATLAESGDANAR